MAASFALFKLRVDGDSARFAFASPNLAALAHDGTARYELGGRPLDALLCLLARADAATLRAALLAPPADAGGFVCWDSADGALRVVATSVMAINGGWRSRELSGRLERSPGDGATAAAARSPGLSPASPAKATEELKQSSRSGGSR